MLIFQRAKVLLQIFKKKVFLKTQYGCLPKCINTKFIYTSTTVFILRRYAKLSNNASTINPMPDCYLIGLKIHIDDVIKYNTLYKYFGRQPI